MTFTVIDRAIVDGVWWRYEQRNELSPNWTRAPGFFKTARGALRLGRQQLKEAYRKMGHKVLIQGEPQRNR